MVKFFEAGNEIFKEGLSLIQLITFSKKSTLSGYNSFVKFKKDEEWEHCYKETTSSWRKILKYIRKDWWYWSIKGSYNETKVDISMIR